MPDQTGRANLPSGTVTFLFSDIAGSTQLLQRLGADYARVLGAHQALLRTAWAAHGGVEVDTAGDGFFVAFSSAPAAVAAAAQATQALAAHAWPDDGRLSVRIGLHTGAPQVVGDHYVGLDVHRAARIAAAGHGGQILLSEATRALTEHELPEGATLRDLGAHRLKDLQHAEHVYQLVLPGLPAEFPPVKSLDARPHNLPLQPTLLLGREEPLAAVCARLRRAGVRLVTLTGPGGIGKTRLAIQVAAELLDDFPDGVWLVRLSRLTDPALVLPTIAQTLGVPERSGQPIAATLRDYLRARTLLLVLDNLEQVVGAAPELAALLEASPGLKVLVTSRIPLHLRGEREYPLDPLPLPDPAHLPSPDHLSQYAAVALFVERASEAQPAFAVTAANAPAIAEICARLDGLPLAIELAAARVKLLPPEALLARLSSRLQLLTGGARDLEERQQTMRATIAWSEGLLSPAERVLFRRLAVFVGGCTLEAAEAVCVAPDGAAPLDLDPLDGLGALVDQSLVHQREEGGEPRFGMLQVIRDYALEQLAASGEAEALSQAHLSYFVTLGDRYHEVELATWSTVESRGWMDRIGRDMDNCRAALAWARERVVASRAMRRMHDAEAAAALEAGMRLTGTLLWFWLSRGPHRECRAWAEGFLALEVASTASPDTDSTALLDPSVRARLAVRARVLLAAGMMARYQGDYEQAITPLERSIALYRALGDRVHLLFPLFNLCCVMEVLGDLTQATLLNEESLALGREVHGPPGTMDPLARLARLALAAGDLEQAEARSEEALTLGLRVGNFEVQSLALAIRALIACQRGQLAQAAAAARTVMELYWASGAVGNYDVGLEICAIVLLSLGRTERAARLLGAAVAQQERSGTAPPAPTTTPSLAEIQAAEAQARAKLGKKRYEAAYAAGRALSTEEAIAEALKVSAQSAELPHVDFSRVANYRK